MEEGKRGRLESTADNQSQIIETNIRQTPDLPTEIIQDIILKLPVKSLSRFKCVSKSWLSFISSPQFVKTHLKLSAKNAAFHRIIFNIHPRHFDLKQCSVSSLVSQPRTAASELDYPNRSSDSAVWVVGSCNGIICIAINGEDLFFWNPSTGKMKELPSACVEMKPRFYYRWGFGYTESDDDYKVVGVFYMPGHRYLELEQSVVMIYSLRANSWKRIGDFSCGIPVDDNGKYANGKLHFASTVGMAYEANHWNIVSLDLKSEGYGIVEQPNYGEERWSDSTLGLLGGCLTVLWYNGTHQVDLWVLKEYGVKESWTRVVVSIPGHPITSKLGSCFNPLIIMPNGEFLVVFKGNLAVYNPNKNSLRRARVWMRNTIVRNILEADIYCESLVPL